MRGRHRVRPQRRRERTGRQSQAVSTPASPSSPTSPTPAAPTKAEDEAKLKKTMVTAKDLGSPWVQPKSVSSVKGKKGEICPGHVSVVREVPTVAEVSAGLTEGKGEGKNIATFTLTTLPQENDSALRGAYQEDNAGLRDV